MPRSPKIWDQSILIKELLHETNQHGLNKRQRGASQQLWCA